MKPESLRRFDTVFLSNAMTCGTIGSKWPAKLTKGYWQTRLLVLLVAALVSASCCGAWAESGDLSVTAPRQASLNPCFAVKNTGLRLVNGASLQAIEVSCGGILTWDIPQGASSFHVTLWRAETANAFATSQPAPNSIAPLRVLISLDGKQAADTVMSVSTPAERWVIPTNHARTLSIETEQESGIVAVYLADPGFSSQAVQTASVRHILSPGQGYTNLGSGPRQAAFFDFHPGEKVPESKQNMAGDAWRRAEVKEISVAPLSGSGAQSISLPITLNDDAGGSTGSGQWQVPAVYGPANIQLTTSVDGHQVYSDSAQVAVMAKAPDPSATSNNSTFGVHISGAGNLFLQDDFASLWGAKQARCFLSWSLIESKQGVYDWHWIDNVIQSYSGQHMNILGVMGELPPSWITDPDTQMMPAYARFVRAALEHFQGKIQNWEVYNEIDSKFYSNSNRGFDRKSDPTGDIQILRQETAQMNQINPKLFKVCCAPGGSNFLQYEKRLFDSRDS